MSALVAKERFGERGYRMDTPQESAYTIKLALAASSVRSVGKPFRTTPAMGTDVLNATEPKSRVRLHVHRLRPPTDNHAFFPGALGESLALRSAPLRPAPFRARSEQHEESSECRLKRRRFARLGQVGNLSERCLAPSFGSLNWQIDLSTHQIYFNARACSPLSPYMGVDRNREPNDGSSPTYRNRGAGPTLTRGGGR